MKIRFWGGRLAVGILLLGGPLAFGAERFDVTHEFAKTYVQLPDGWRVEGGRVDLATSESLELVLPNERGRVILNRNKDGRLSFFGGRFSRFGQGIDVPEDSVVTRSSGTDRTFRGGFDSNGYSGAEAQNTYATESTTSTTFASKPTYFGVYRPKYGKHPGKIELSIRYDAPRQTEVGFEPGPGGGPTNFMEGIKSHTIRSTEFRVDGEILYAALSGNPDSGYSLLIVWDDGQSEQLHIQEHRVYVDESHNPVIHRASSRFRTGTIELKVFGITAKNRFRPSGGASCGKAARTR